MHTTTLRIADMALADAEVTRIETRYLIHAKTVPLPDGYLPRATTCDFEYCGRSILGIIVKTTIERSDWSGDPSLHDIKLEVIADPAR